MLGYILSKINLLIFVVAIFSIVTYFTFGLVEIVKADQSRLLLRESSKKLSSILSSSTTCEVVYDVFRPSVNVLERKNYYVVRVTTQEIMVDDKAVDYLIYSMFDRREYIDDPDEAKSITASSVRTMDSEINFYYWDNCDYTDVCSRDWQDSEEAIIDPQSTSQANTLIYVKELEGGITKLHVIPCSISSCGLAKTKVGEIVHPPNLPEEEGGFKC
ncbi:MAG: hypothetical protein ABID38_04610 [Candidatus Diapherotrites archaeon]